LNYYKQNHYNSKQQTFAISEIGMLLGQFKVHRLMLPEEKTTTEVNYIINIKVNKLIVNTYLKFV